MSEEFYSGKQLPASIRKEIKNWPIDDMQGMLEYVGKIWGKPGSISNIEEGMTRLNTHGNPWNESIIQAMHSNPVWWAMYWFRSQAGGHYTFGKKIKLIHMFEDSEEVKMVADRDVINRYYTFRGLKPPKSEEALLFLLSEVGELVEAWIGVTEPTLSDREHRVMEKFVEMGKEADDIVSQRGGWVRNNGRKGSLDLPGEFGDVLMMLDRFAYALGQKEPSELLAEKMQKKGFGVL